MEFVKRKFGSISGMQKTIRVEAVDTHTFRLTHRVENVNNAWKIRCAPWGLQS